MLHSRATAALMKLKEIDRKYKIKWNEDVKQNSSLSDISAIDSIDKISNKRVSVPVSSDNRDAQNVTPRTKIDIRMPDTYMERTETRQSLKTKQIEPAPNLVTIFDKSEKKSPKKNSDDSKKMTAGSNKSIDEQNETLASEGNISDDPEHVASLEGRSLSKEQKNSHSDTSISEEVPEVDLTSTSHTLNAGSDHPNVSHAQKITSKSVGSIIDDEEWAENVLDKDPSNSVTFNGTYSDDFVKTLTENAGDSNISSEQGINAIDSPSYNQLPEPESNKTTELVMLKELSKSEVSLDSSPSNSVKSKKVECPVRLSKSSRTSSSRSSKTHRRNTSSGDFSTLKSEEFLSSFEYRKHGTMEISVQFNNGEENDVRNSHTLSLLEVKDLKEKNKRETDVKLVSRNLKNEKIALKVKSKSAKNRMKFQASPMVDRSLEHSLNDHETKNTSVVSLSQRHEDNRRFSKVPYAQNRRSKKLKTKGKKNSGSFKDEPELRSGTKDMDDHRQQIKEIRLRRERDQLRSRVRGYVLEIIQDKQNRILAADGPEDLKNKQNGNGTNGPRQNDSLKFFFKPLDLPNIAAFKRSDFEESKTAELEENEKYLHLRMIRERILGIRHWLKQQFILYRDYSSLVSTVNAMYIPVTLKETKKMIRDMQRFYNSNDRRYHVE